MEFGQASQDKINSSLNFITILQEMYILYFYHYMGKITNLK